MTLAGSPTAACVRNNSARYGQESPHRPILYYRKFRISTAITPSNLVTQYGEKAGVGIPGV